MKQLHVAESLALSNEFINEVTESPRDPIGGASGEKRHFTVRFLGKTNNEAFPFTVANEVVASHIGRALGLNVPTVLTHTVSGQDYALIQLVGRTPQIQQPPRETARTLQEYVRTHADEVHGAIVFDLFLANNDRAFGPERRNLLLDADNELLLYDNGNCCFYRNRPQAKIKSGIPRLNAVEKTMGAMFDMDHKQNHFREFLDDLSLTSAWCDRIKLLPEFIIDSAIKLIPKQSAGEAERERLAEFLKTRKDRLFEEIEKNRHLFSGLPS